MQEMLGELGQSGLFFITKAFIKKKSKKNTAKLGNIISEN